MHAIKSKKETETYCLFWKLFLSETQMYNNNNQRKQTLVYFICHPNYGGDRNFQLGQWWCFFDMPP